MSGRAPGDRAPVAVYAERGRSGGHPARALQPPLPFKRWRTHARLAWARKLARPPLAAAFGQLGAVAALRRALGALGRQLIPPHGRFAVAGHRLGLGLGYAHSVRVHGARLVRFDDARAHQVESLARLGAEGTADGDFVRHVRGAGLPSVAASGPPIRSERAMSRRVMLSSCATSPTRRRSATSSGSACVWASRIQRWSMRLERFRFRFWFALLASLSRSSGAPASPREDRAGDDLRPDASRRESGLPSSHLMVHALLLASYPRTYAASSTKRRPSAQVVWITIAIPSTTPRHVTSHGRSPPPRITQFARREMPFSVLLAWTVPSEPPCPVLRAWRRSAASPPRTSPPPT